MKKKIAERNQRQEKYRAEQVNLNCNGKKKKIKLLITLCK